MSSKAPKAPPAPDPYAVAGAQTGSNVTTAVANSWLGNANVNSPLGTSRTRQTGTKKVTDPTTGKTYSVPVFTQDIKLSAAQQQLMDQQNALGSQMNTMAMSQADRLAAHLSNNADLTGGLPGMREGPQNLSTGGLPELKGLSAEGLPELADNMDEYRGQVESGLMERMNPQLERDYSSLENRLVNQGLARGSKAFETAMDENRRQANDARTQIFLASGNEARAMQGEQRANRGQLFGERTAIGETDRANRGQLFNERVTVNNDARANLESDIGRRNQTLQERLTARNQPINEITALMGGGQVSMPQFSGYQGGQVEGTPVGQYIYKSHDIQQQQAQQAAESRANQFNSIGKIGAGMFAWSDRRLKRDVRFVHTDANGIDWFVFRYVPSVGLSGWQYGVMAQDLQKTHPDLVVTMPNGYLAVDYGRL